MKPSVEVYWYKPSALAAFTFCLISIWVTLFSAICDYLCYDRRRTPVLQPQQQYARVRAAPTIQEDQGDSPPSYSTIEAQTHR